MSLDTSPRRMLLGHEAEPADDPADADAGEQEPTTRRRRSRKDKSPDIEPEAAPDDSVIPMPEGKGSRSRPNPSKARKGWYAPRSPGGLSTTRQTEILNTAVIAAPTDDEGVAIGRDHLSKATIAHDPFTAYKKKVIHSPNVLVLGDVGGGKSSLLKTVYVLRPLILKHRRCVVIDKKDRGGEGEYAELTRWQGGEPLRFS